MKSGARRLIRGVMRLSNVGYADEVDGRQNEETGLWDAHDHILRSGNNVEANLAPHIGATRCVAWTECAGLNHRLTVQLKLLFISCLFEAYFIWDGFFVPENSSRRYFLLTQMFASVVGPILLVAMTLFIIIEQLRRK